MKVATWNVNGIRAREAQFVEWVRRDKPGHRLPATRSRPTQEQLSEIPHDRLPESTGATGTEKQPKGYSGVSLHFRKEAYPVRPVFSHPAFDFENRVVEAQVDGGPLVASVYVPNGGKDYGAKLKFIEALRDRRRFRARRQVTSIVASAAT